MRSSNKTDETNKRLRERIKSFVRHPIHSLMDELFADCVEGAEERRVETLSYLEVLEYAADLRAQNPQVTAILLNRRPAEGEWSLEQVFTNPEGDLIPKGRGLLGRRLKVQSFDEELADVFAEGNTVVVEIPAASLRP